MFEVNLVNSVRRYPCLYDANMDKTRLIVDMAWKTVSREIGVEVQVCRNRWKSIRDRFVKYYKSPEVDHMPPWSLREDMEFLKDHVLFCNKTTTTKENDVSHKEISSCTTEPTEDEVFCTKDKSDNEEMRFIFEMADDISTSDTSKAQYSIQTPEENTNETNNYFKLENSRNNHNSANSSEHRKGLHSTKRYFNGATDTNGSAKVNSNIKKRKLFLNGLVGSQNSIPLPTTKQNCEDPLTKYDTLIDTLNKYIRSRIKEEEQSTNEDFFKVLDTYLMKLPESVQDELMAKILLQVLNKNNVN